MALACTCYVTPDGGKRWRLKSCYVGKEKLLSLGPWPDITLDAAREKAAEARPALHDGKDPARGYRAARGGIDGAALGVLAAAWADKQAWAPSTEKRERYLLAQWTSRLGAIPARALTPADIRPVVLAIERDGYPENARRVLAQIGRVLRHAVALGHAERDVAADLGDVLAPVQSEKYATLTKPAEIAELMRAIYTYSGDPSTCYCLRILPLVFTRPGELRNARCVIGELKVVKSGRFETRRLFGLVLIVSFDRLVLPGVFPSYNKWLRGG